MSRNLKALGLGLIGSLALAAVVASSASAVNFHSGSFTGTTYVTATSDSNIQLDLVNGTNVKCGHVQFEGSYASTTASDLSLKARFTQCLASGQQATVDTSKCIFTLTTPTQTTDNDNYDGVVDLVCTGGSLVVFVGDPVASCTLLFHSQTLKSVFDYTNITGSPKDVTVARTATIDYTSSGSVCGANGTGKLTGTLTAKAYSDAGQPAQVDLWVA